MSNFVVSARKYRPKTFDEVVGQGHVSDTLKKALSSEKIAHAYLFCGPRGVGKTTCARILAKVVNCQNTIDKHTPCNECSSCLSFEQNASFNIIELDAASNNSVENIRSLIEQVRIQPQSGSYKIFIIDEVHMLSQAAFNAFLKTLEEPPSYVIFIMATTEKHKILPTILSRCQIYDFKRIQPSDIVPQLQFILEQENKTADAEALHIIGQKADGAMRDALSIFDRIASSTGEHISYKDVVDNLNLLDYDYFFSVTDNLLLEKLGPVMLDFDDVLHKGFEADQFVHGLADHFRNLLMLSHAETATLLDVGESLLKRYKDQAEIISKNTLMTFLNIANECDIHYVMSRNKRLHVEVALSKMVYASRLLQTGSLSLEEKKTEVVSEGKEKLKSTDTFSTAESTPIISNPPSKETSNAVSQSEVISKTDDFTSTDETEVSPSKDNETSVDENKVEETNTKSTLESEKLNADKLGKDEAVQTRADLLNNPTKISSIGGISIPDISASTFDNIEAEVRKETLEREENLVEITEETVKAIIKDYEKSHKSKSIRQVLNLVIIEIDEDIIKLYVPSVIAKESIDQQNQLMDNLRETFGKTDLSIPVIISPDKFPNYSSPAIKAKLTDKEKYLTMVEKNPLVKDLQKIFDLQPEQ